MNKLRVSFSLLSMWRQGRVEDCVNSYFKLKEITNPYMEEGKKWDNVVNAYVRQNSSLPPEFGGEKLVNPIVQEKWEVPFGDWILVGIPDVQDEPTLIEIKTGNSKDSGDYCNDFQVAMYLFMGDLMGKNFTKGIIKHYNQFTKELDNSWIYNTSFERERAKNYILTLSPEIENYFLENNLFEKYGKMPLDMVKTDMLI